MIKRFVNAIVIGSCLLSFNDPILSQTNFQQQIINAHNQYRQGVNVSPLTWSNTLAKDAQKWANHLASLGGNQLKHDPDLKGQGENLWLGTANRYSYTHMVDSWGKEKQYFIPGRFHPENISSTGSWSDVGHYTQIVWENTKQVGCAIATAGGNEILVCRYSPPGNIIGQPVY